MNECSHAFAHGPSQPCSRPSRPSARPSGQSMGARMERSTLHVAMVHNRSRACTRIDWPRGEGGGSSGGGIGGGSGAIGPTGGARTALVGANPTSGIQPYFSGRRRVRSAHRDSTGLTVQAT